MKKRTVVLTSALVSLFAAAVVLNACKDNVYTMLDDYNSHFSPGTDWSKTKYPGDEGFDETRMLDDLYSVSSDGTITLAAPFNCKAYDWHFYKTLNEATLDLALTTNNFKATALEDITDRLFYYNSSGKNTREFIVYIPKSQISVGESLGPGTYVLKLSVVGNDDLTYSDWCKVVIFEQIYGQSTFFKED